MIRPRTAIIPALALALLGACSKAPDPAPSRPAAQAAVSVIVEPLQLEPARTRVEAVGTSRARLSAEIYPATSGEVVAVDFEPGQRVKAGDVLVELDRREEELALRLARLRLEDAERLYDRYVRSSQSGAVLPTVLDEARTAAETARVELEQAEIALAYRNVKAVFDGYVGSTEVDPGDRVNPNTLITTLDDRSSLFVSFDIPEAFIGELKVGEKVDLETWSVALPEVTGEIVDIGSRIDPRKRTFVARAQVPNTDDTLRPGMSFRVRVDVEGELYPVIAETGVQWGADGAYVWSIVDGTARRVPVEIVQRRQGRVLVDGALQSGDIIVVEGIQFMRDGTPVRYDQARLVRQQKTISATVTAGAGGDDAASFD